MKPESVSSIEPEENRPSLRVFQDEAGKEALLPGQTIESGEKISSVESKEKTEDVLSVENKSFFQKMSEGGKELAGKFYEGLYKIPGINKVVGKMEIAYNQLWIDRHEEKAAGFKTKIESLNTRVGTLDQSSQEIESTIEKFNQEGFPGVPSLELKLKEVAQRKVALQNEKDRMQAKFDERSDKARLYAGKRDEIADRFIGRYSEKLAPMETELENLQTYRDQTELLAAVTEVQHNEQLHRLDEMEKSKLQLEEVLRNAGESEKKIRKFPAITALEKNLARGRESIRKESEVLAKKRAGVDAKIAQVNAKAEPYRNKRSEFVRVKEGRPLTKTKEATANSGGLGAGETSIGAGGEGGGVENSELGITMEKRKKLSVREYIYGWNDYLVRQMGQSNAAEQTIDAAKFEETTKLKVNFELNPKEFKRILKSYLKFKKISTIGFSRYANDFFNEDSNSERRAA